MNTEDMSKPSPTVSETFGETFGDAGAQTRAALEDIKALAAYATDASAPGRDVPPHIDEPLLTEYGTPEQLGALYGALAAAAGEFGTVEKTAKVGFKNVSYTYAPLANLVNAVRKPLSKHGVFCTQQFTMGKDEVRGTITTIVAAHGARLVSKICFKPEGDIKSMGGQVTYLKRYALCGVFMLDGVDDADQFEEKTPSGAGDDKPQRRPRNQAPRPEVRQAGPPESKRPPVVKRPPAARRQEPPKEEGPPPPSDADAPQDPMAEPRAEVMDKLRKNQEKANEAAVQEHLSQDIEDVPTPVPASGEPMTPATSQQLRAELKRTGIKVGVLGTKCLELTGEKMVKNMDAAHADALLEYLGSIEDGKGASL